ncbi:MAG: hypothetical protein H0W36_00325 [Gemmatimonadetes bacterium]|nr:hypothetical protein [Gemmatimonadota bacterium]
MVDPLLLRGLMAAVFGAVAMTLSSTTEMYLRGRPPSETPGEAGNKLLGLFGLSPQRGRRLTLLSTWVHWIYSTIWGVVFWFLMDPSLAGLELAIAGSAFFFLVWGAALVGLPILGLAPPFWRWGANEVAIDAWHHVMYVTGTVTGWWLIGIAA